MYATTVITDGDSKTSIIQTLPNIDVFLSPHKKQQKLSTTCLRKQQLDNTKPEALRFLLCSKMILRNSLPCQKRCADFWIPVSQKNPCRIHGSTPLCTLKPSYTLIQRVLLGTPNREPQEYSRNVIGIYLPESLYSIIFLLYSWGSLFGFSSKVPLPEGPKGSPVQRNSHASP